MKRDLPNMSTITHLKFTYLFDFTQGNLSFLIFLCIDEDFIAGKDLKYISCLNKSKRFLKFIK